MDAGEIASQMSDLGIQIYIIQKNYKNTKDKIVKVTNELN